MSSSNLSPLRRPPRPAEEEPLLAGPGCDVANDGYDVANDGYDVANDGYDFDGPGRQRVESVTVASVVKEVIAVSAEDPAASDTATGRGRAWSVPADVVVDDQQHSPACCRLTRFDRATIVTLSFCAVAIFVFYACACLTIPFIADVGKQLGINEDWTGLILSAYPAGVVVGSMLIPRLSQKLGATAPRVIVSAAAGSMCLPLLFLALTPDITSTWAGGSGIAPTRKPAANQWLFFLTFLTLGIIGAAEAAVYTLAVGATVGKTPFVMALLTTCGAVGSMLGPPLGGALYSAPAAAAWKWRTPYLTIAVVFAGLSAVGFLVLPRYERVCRELVDLVLQAREEGENFEDEDALKRRGGGGVVDSPRPARRRKGFKQESTPPSPNAATTTGPSSLSPQRRRRGRRKRERESLIVVARRGSRAAVDLTGLKTAKQRFEERQQQQQRQHEHEHEHGDIDHQNGEKGVEQEQEPPEQQGGGQEALAAKLHLVTATRVAAVVAMVLCTMLVAGHDATIGYRLRVAPFRFTSATVGAYLAASSLSLMVANVPLGILLDRSSPDNVALHKGLQALAFGCLVFTFFLNGPVDFGSLQLHRALDKPGVTILGMMFKVRKRIASRLERRHIRRNHSTARHPTTASLSPQLIG